MTAFLRRYVERHNEGVRSGDFGPMLALFHPDAVFEFVGFGIGRLRGVEEIARAFETNPPTDELVIVETSGAKRVASAVYAWRKNRDAGGELTIEGDPGGIRRIAVARSR